jgi:hypothetical protein
MSKNIKFSSAEGNPFLKAYLYIQANRNEWDEKISAIEYNTERAKRFKEQQRALRWMIKHIAANKSLASNRIN